jgi:hypothetical protein
MPNGGFPVPQLQAKPAPTVQTPDRDARDLAAAA